MGTPPPQAGGKTTEWRTAAPQRPHTERSAETILAQFAYHDTKAHKALCTICNFRLHALQAFAQLFRDVPKRAQIAARRPDFPCFTARFSHLSPESHRAKHPRTAPVLPPKNAPLRAYAKPRPHPRVRGTRQHATTFAFFTFSARYERICGPPKTNFCPAEGRKWGRLRSKMLKNGLQTKKSTFSFGRLVI